MSIRMLQLVSWLVPLVIFAVATRACGELRDLGTRFVVSGKIADMRRVERRSGQTLQVTMRGLSCRGRVDRTLVEQKADGRITFWLALSDLKLTIQRTEIEGHTARARCGPMTILLGNRRNLWLALDVEQRAGGRPSGFKLLSTRFRLPADNWSIGTPSWVQTSGFGMNRQNVVAGLRKGLANNRSRIEQRLIQFAPTMLAQSVLPSGTPRDDATPIVEAVGRAFFEQHIIAGRKSVSADRTNDREARLFRNSRASNAVVQRRGASNGVSIRMPFNGRQTSGWQPTRK